MSPVDQKDSRRIIQSFEAGQLKDRNYWILVADWLTTSFGTITFFVCNAIVFAFWIVINLGWIPDVPIFDPYPFNFLTMTVSLEAIFLSIIVLISQNRQSKISTLREELDMQVNLIAEDEITMTLKVLKRIADKLDIKITDEEFVEMTKETDISYIQREIEDQLAPPVKNPQMPFAKHNS